MILSSEQQAQIGVLLRHCGEIMCADPDPEHAKGEITQKDGAANYVTVYDVQVQTYLENGLIQIFPAAKFIAEEQENDPVSAARGLCFVIDPIDGTTNFIHHMGASAVSVALFSDGEPVYGAVYDPYRKELFFALVGCGAYLNGKKITVSDRDLPHALVSLGTAPYNRDALADAVFDKAKRIFLHCADIRRSGSAALDMCYVACGRTDAFFEEILSPWDFAAGQLIVSEAGGRLTDYAGKKPEFGYKSAVLCSNGCVHDSLLQLLN